MVVGLALPGRVVGHDLSGFDPEGPVPELPATEGLTSRQQLMLDLARREGLIPTVVENDFWFRSRIFAKPKVSDIWAWCRKFEIIQRPRRSRAGPGSNRCVSILGRWYEPAPILPAHLRARGHLQIVGTPAQIVDEMEARFRAGAPTASTSCRRPCRAGSTTSSNSSCRNCAAAACSALSMRAGLCGRISARARPPPRSRRRRQLDVVPRGGPQERIVSRSHRETAIGDTAFGNARHIVDNSDKLI